MSASSGGRDRRAALERALDFPEKAVLWLPWPSTARIIVKGSFGFLKQAMRSRLLGLRSGELDGNR